MKLPLLAGLGLMCGAGGCHAGDDASFAQRRDTMVREHIDAGGIRDPKVLAAMRKVPRHEFVPAEWRDRAYDDRPLPIGENQTISQPYI